AHVPSPLPAGARRTAREDGGGRGDRSIRAVQDHVDLRQHRQEPAVARRGAAESSAAHAGVGARRARRIAVAWLLPCNRQEPRRATSVISRRPVRKTCRPRRDMRLVSSAGEPTMTRATIASGAFATVVVLLAVAAGYWLLHRDVHPAAATSPAITPSTTPAAEAHPAAW